MMKRAIPQCTPAEQERQDKARTRGCIACVMSEATDQCGDSEINHMTYNGRQISQAATECLGKWHHRGICKPGMTAAQMTAKYGPSLAVDKRRFEAAYGDNEARRYYQNKLIGAEHAPIKPYKRRTALSSKKIVPRRAA